jgi:hydroxyethylthiazole kinase-like uncharacterized protein yjeF
LLNTPNLWQHLLPQFTAHSHKYSRGHCVVWSGSVLRTGASRLAAMAALRSGAGLVTLIGERDALMVQAAHVTAIMLREISALHDFDELVMDDRIKSLVIGPAAGVEHRIRHFIVAGCRAGRNMVIDADGLSVFAGRLPELAEAAAQSAAATVLTPHEEEFKRLFPDISGSREQRALAAAALTGAVVVLKGAHTLIAHPDGRCVANTNAPPDLATAGSGDVLAGIIGGLLAQGMEGFVAACAAVFVHGLAGQRGGKGLIAEDLPHLLPVVFENL